MASRPARSDSSPPEPPRGWRRVGWLGPGFLWMVSAAGSRWRSSGRFWWLAHSFVGFWDTALTLVLNARVLPRELRPARVTMIATAGAAMFFVAFAVYYIWSLAAGAGGG